MKTAAGELIRDVVYGALVERQESNFWEGDLEWMLGP